MVGEVKEMGEVKEGKKGICHNCRDIREYYRRSNRFDD